MSDGFFDYAWLTIGDGGPDRTGIHFHSIEVSLHLVEMYVLYWLPFWSSEWDVLVLL